MTSLSLLYVEDDTDLLEAGRQYLERSGGFSVTTAISARQALELKKKSFFDAIISDYEMPDMNGIELLRVIRDEPDNIPFIIFTGRGSEDVAISALNAGADYYVQKGGGPKTHFAELINIVNKAVRERQAASDLRNSNQLSMQMIDHLPDATFGIDTDGMIIAWNKAMEDLTGVPAQAAIGRGDNLYSQFIYGFIRPMLIDLVLFPDLDVSSHFSYILHDGEVVMGETTLSMPNVETRILWGKASPLYNDHGLLIGAIQSVRDVTSLRIAEKGLLESKKRLEELIEFLPDATFAIDANGRVIAWNRAIEKMTGASRTEMLGSGDYHYSLPFYGEKRPILIDLVFKDIEEIRKEYEFIEEKDGYVVGEVFSHRLFGGKGGYLWGIAAPFRNAEGKVTGAIESIRDLTEKRQNHLHLEHINEELRAALFELAKREDELKARFDELRENERLLAESEGKLKHLLSSLLDAVYLTESDSDNRPGRIIMANPAAYRMLGYPPGGLVGLFVSDIDAGVLNDETMALISQISLQNDPILFEQMHRSYDGRLIPVEIHARMLEIGGKKYFLSVVRDISERKEEERERRKLFEAFLAILDTMDAGIYVADPVTYGLIFMNKMFRDTFGEGLGKKCYAVLQNGQTEPCPFCSTPYLPDPESDPDSYYQWDFQNTITGRWYDCRDRLIRWTDGRLVRMEIAIDITEKKEMVEALSKSEEMYRSLFYNAHDGMFLMKDGIFVDCNPRACELFGCNKEDIVGLTPASLSPPEQPDGRNSKDLSDQIINEKQSDSLSVIEWTYQRFDGTSFETEISLSPLHIGQEKFVLSIARDISYRKSIERKLLQTSAALEKANEKLHLLSDMTRHDILNALSETFLFLGLTQGGDIDEKTSELLKKIEDSLERILSHIEFTRYYQEIGVNSPSWTDLGYLISRQIMLFEERAVKFQVNIPKIMIYADPLFERVIYNLIENSFRHGEGVTMISFSWKKESDGGLLLYTDDGIGIADAYKEKIFDRGCGKNTGLGLFLCREILDITKMKIRECGVKGKGVRFEISVPSESLHI